MSAEIPNRHGKMEGKGKNHKSRDCIAMGRLCFRRECGYKVEQVKCDISEVILCWIYAGGKIWANMSPPHESQSVMSCSYRITVKGSFLLWSQEQFFCP